MTDEIHFILVLLEIELVGSPERFPVHIAQVIPGRILAVFGKLDGKALASKHPFNVSGSYLENLFAGNTKTAPCTDVVNKEWSGKDLAGGILCFPTAIGS